MNITSAKTRQNRPDEPIEDSRIIELYFARDEQAIEQTRIKYGSFLLSLAFGILRDSGDSEEAVSDTMLGAWNAMPPHRPDALRHFLARITRNICFDRLDRLTAKKRCGESLPLMGELAECIPDENAQVEIVWEARELARLLNDFLSGLDRLTCAVFVSRCFYSMNTAGIAEKYSLTERRVKYLLSRTRARLRAFLEEQGSLASKKEEI